MRIPVLTTLVAISAGCASPVPDRAPENPVTRVALTRVAAGDVVSFFEAGGVVRSRETAVIASRVLAPIAQVHVRAGDRVLRGSPLVTLDAGDIDAERHRAEAGSQSAAQLVRAAEADVEATDAAFVLAQATYVRTATLHEKKSATAQELDQATASVRAADAQRSAARFRLASAEASRAAAEASARAAAIVAGYAVVTAPFDGVVTDRRADAGSMAAPGSPLLVLDDPSAYRLEVQVDAARARFVQAGQEAAVRLDDGTGEDAAWIPARVAEIARIDPANHAFLVKLELPTVARLRSGLFGRARFSGPTKRALTVPGGALVPRGQLTFVYIVDSDRRARLRPVAVGTSDGERTEVLAGLQDGDLIVANPPPSLVDGTRVEGEPE